MRRVAVALFVLATACSGKTVHLGTGSGSASPSAGPRTTVSPPAATRSWTTTTKGPQPATTPVTPAPAAPYTQNSGIEGAVVAGPTCPVERPDSPCPDRPVPDAAVTATNGSHTRGTQTGNDGRFKLDLAAGTYDVTATSKGVFGCDTKTVRVVAHKVTRVTITCDSGIR